MAAGGRIESGFEVLAEQARLDEALEGADLVITGEGFLDVESFRGKVVGGVVGWAGQEGVPALVVVGDQEDGLDLPDHVTVVSLVEQFGRDQAMARTTDLVADVVARHLAAD